MPKLLPSFVVAVFLSIAGCTPHNDPLAEWTSLGNFLTEPVPESIKQDAWAYIQTLPISARNAAIVDTMLTYLAGPDGQHAVVLWASDDGEYWHYAMIYDREDRRIETLKYSTGSYSS